MYIIYIYMIYIEAYFIQSCFKDTSNCSVLFYFILFYFILFYYFILSYFILFYFILFYFIVFFRVTLTAYGSSQARGRISYGSWPTPRATAIPNRSCVCDLYHSLWQHWILNPLSEARYRNLILMNASQLISAEPQWELPIALFKCSLLLSPTTQYIWYSLSQ